ncbi:uncharacterized protein TNCV_3575281 [Trichonephila clavipes]|nr:uncharacterized protein TNCV_3575281 [Trichonephila clavipes]
MDEQLKALLRSINALKSGQDDMQKSQEETEERMEKGQQETKKVEEKIERIKEQVEERIKEQVEERIEGLAEKFSLISQRMEDLEKKLLDGGNENKDKSMPVPAFSEPVLVSPVPVTAFTGPVKLSTYDGKTNWEVYKTQFCLISEANGWNEGVKACQLAASLRGKAAEVLQALLDIERLNLNSLYQGWQTRGMRAIDATCYNIFDTSVIKMVCILFQNF